MDNYTGLLNPCGAFLQKIVTKVVNYSYKKLPSHMFGKVLITPPIAHVWQGSYYASEF